MKDKLYKIIKPSELKYLTGDPVVPNFLTHLDKNKAKQSEIWSGKTYKVNPDTYVFTTLQEHFGNRLLKNLNLPNKSTVVDIGCFIGEKLWQLNREMVDLGVGIDIAVPSLVAASEIDKQGNQFLAADVENLPIKSSCVDLVIAFDVIEHLTHQEKGFSEISRVLKPGGQLLLHIPIKDNKWSYFGLKMKMYPKSAEKEYLDVGHTPGRMLTSKQIHNYLNKYKMGIKREIFYNSFFIHFFDRELPSLILSVYMKLFSDTKQTSVNTTKNAIGSRGVLRTVYGKYIIPILELISWPDWILSKLRIGNTIFILAEKE